jgi:hypothetical protein
LPSHAGTDDGGFGGGGGFAAVSVITLPPHAGSSKRRAKMMGEIRSITKSLGQDLQDVFRIYMLIVQKSGESCL